MYSEMFYIHVRWKPLLKFIMAWLILWPWFIINRISSKKKEEIMDYVCPCGTYSPSKWYGWHKWKNWLVTYTDVGAPASHEYGGCYWLTHVICWKCGRYYNYPDSSV